jgi:hypothetical protein
MMPFTLAPVIFLCLCAWALYQSKTRSLTFGLMLATWLIAFFVLPFAARAIGFSASNMRLPSRIIRAGLTLTGADPVSSRRNEAAGNDKAAMADLWTLPSFLFPAVVGMIHAAGSRRSLPTKATP